MPVFYYHPRNSVGQKLQEINGSKGFLYTNRGEMELRLNRQLAEAGYDIWPTYHCVVGSLAGCVDMQIALDPDDELDRHSIKLCATKTPWTYVKVINGPKMSCVVGYCSSSANSPFSMTNAEMAQKGIISSSYIPRQLG